MSVYVSIDTERKRSLASLIGLVLPGEKAEAAKR